MERGLKRKSAGFLDEEVGDLSVPKVNEERDEGEPPPPFLNCWGKLSERFGVRDSVFVIRCS